MPKISIILPVYNASKTLATAIKSVLAQSFVDFELIIINDGSSDQTKEVIESYHDPRIKYLEHKFNYGPDLLAKTLNEGLKIAAGQYIARLDADDEWLDSEKLKNQMAFMEKNPDYVLLGTGAIVSQTLNKGSFRFLNLAKELFRFLNPATDAEIRRLILGRNQFIHSSVLFKKETAQKLNGYGESPDLKHVEDYDLWLKLGTAGKMANWPSYAVQYNLSARQISSANFKDQIKKSFKLAKKYRDFYPGYWTAMGRICLRNIFYGYGQLSFLKKISARFKK